MPRFICPKCGEDNVDVQVIAWARVSANSHDNVETDITDAEDGDQEWGCDSPMRCRDCGFCGQVELFDTEPAEDDEEVAS